MVPSLQWMSQLLPLPELTTLLPSLEQEDMLLDMVQVLTILDMGLVWDIPGTELQLVTLGIKMVSGMQAMELMLLDMLLDMGTLLLRLLALELATLNMLLLMLLAMDMLAHSI